MASFRKNPFNGIERWTPSTYQRISMPTSGNPFNGIERGRSRHTTHGTTRIPRIHSMELKVIYRGWRVFKGVRWVIGGETPSFTFSVSMEGKS